MVKTYANHDDVIKRLNDTLVFYKGTPHHVYDDQPKQDWKKITIYDMKSLIQTDKKKPKKVPIIIDHDDPNLNTASPVLGLANIGTSCYYASRGMWRRQNQGLGRTSIQWNPKPGFNAFFDEGFYKMLINDYPTEEEAVHLVKSLEADRVAISRNTAIGMDKFNTNICLYHASAIGFRTIGYQMEGGRFQLIPSDDISFIRRNIERSGVIKHVS